MSSPSIKKTMVSGIVWMTAAKGVAQSIGWIITIAVVRLLTPQDYGLMGMALPFSAFILLFSEIGLGAAIIQKQDLSEDQLSQVRWVLVDQSSPLSFVTALRATRCRLLPRTEAYGRGQSVKRDVCDARRWSTFRLLAATSDGVPRKSDSGVRREHNGRAYHAQRGGGRLWRVESRFG